MTSSSLFHWGIPGMKWGVRRNRRGGSSTSESADHKAVKSLRRKKISEMSNDELKKLTTRMQLEKQLKDLSSSEGSRGKKFVNDVLSEAGKKVATKFVSDTISFTIEAVTKKSGLNAAMATLIQNLNNKGS